MRFVELPHLPDSAVTHVLLDTRAYDKTVYILEDFNIEIVFCQKCKDVYEAISSHPDIFYFHFGDNLIFAAPNSPQKTTEQLIMLGFNIIFGNSKLKDKYPDDIAYNIARIGDNVFHNFRYTDKIILKKLYEKGLNLINVNQGYTKCSILPISQNAIITSDIIIHKKAIENKIDSLLISPGYIKLYDKNYGFIGGCAGAVRNDVILFNGDIKKHPDFNAIKNFTKKYNIDIFYTPDLELADIGSIIPLCQL